MIGIEHAKLVELAQHSHDVIASHQQPGGAYPASPTFSAYRGYAWLRDGAFTAEGMSRFGAIESVNAFHDWASRMLEGRADQLARIISLANAGHAIPREAMLPTRFAFDDPHEADPWWNFQTDGYGIWLWSVITHARRHGTGIERWRAGMEVATDYACAFWESPCYDWWEENVDERHLSTLGALYGGLSAVASSGVLDPARTESAASTALLLRDKALREGVSNGIDRPVHLVKWIGSNSVDASLASAIIPFGLFDRGDPIARATLDAIRADLDFGGGVHRYVDDVFYGGGQWPLLSCLIGWNEAAVGDRESAMAHLVWVAKHANGEGEMPEQVDDHLLSPGDVDEWVQRWGDVASPLLWAHGMYLILAHELGLLDK